MNIFCIRELVSHAHQSYILQTQLRILNGIPLVDKRQTRSNCHASYSIYRQQADRNNHFLRFSQYEKIIELQEASICPLLENAETAFPFVREEFYGLCTEKHSSRLSGFGN